MGGQLGQSIEDIKITDPHVRLKMWFLLQDMIAEIAHRHGARFIPVPRELQDEEGFLLEQLLASGRPPTPTPPMARSC